MPSISPQTQAQSQTQTNGAAALANTMANNSAATNRAAVQSPDVQSFLTEIDSLVAMAKSNNIPVRGYTDQSLEKLLTINETRRNQIRDLFRFFKEICEQATADGLGLKNDKTMLWYAIKKMGLRPTSDLLDRISDGDVIEIYDANFIQVYRNFAFFDISSYSLADVFMYEWRDLYRRDDAITMKIAQKGIDVFSGKHKTSIDPEIPEHTIDEIFSPEMYRMKMQQKIFSPLFDKSGAVIAVVATSSVSVLETNAGPPSQSKSNFKNVSTAEI